jgi:hypothetical protein
MAQRQRKAGGRVPPHDRQAEESLLGAAMLADAALETTIAETTADDFYVPAHAHIRMALEEAWLDGVTKADPVVLAKYIQQAGMMEAIGGPSVLITLQARTPATSNARRYARIVAEAGVLRRMIGVAGEIAEMGYSIPDDVSGVLDQAKALLDDVAVPIDTSRFSPTIEDVLSVRVEYDWLVKGLLERHERLILTAAEGAGKTTLMRQLSVCFASGIHPFRNTRIDPVPVLFIDCENPPGILRREYRKIHAQAARDLDPDLLRIEERPEGLDLLGRRDRQWLYERVAANRPAVLMIGPLYKLHNDDENEVRPARQVQHVLDQARNRYGQGAALILEAHAPHGPRNTRELRPRGHSVWLGWPEFGYGIRKDRRRENLYWFEPWRGSREVREWPYCLRRGGHWPWSETEPPRDDAPPPGDEPVDDF